MILGIGGLARSGKDTFCSLAMDFCSDRKIQCERFAFADELKKDLDSFLLKEFKISAFSNSPCEKKIIRPILVAYGNAKRMVSENMHWINTIKNKVLTMESHGALPIITDLRFDNEVDWVNSTGGMSVHITREGIAPPNEEEKENDPKVKAKSSHEFYWKNFQKNLPDEARARVFDFMKNNFL